MTNKADIIHITTRYDDITYVNYLCFNCPDGFHSAFTMLDLEELQPSEDDNVILSPSECSMMLPTWEVFEACS